MNSLLSRMLKRLQVITRDCREDMHEPDEQDLELAVFDGSFDNAMMDDTEAYIVLHRTDDEGKVTADKFNLACLIALARMAGAPKTPTTKDMTCGCCGEEFDLIWDTVPAHPDRETTLVINKQHIKEHGFSAITHVYIECPHCQARKDLK
jgi:hypothetical protein